MSETAEIMLSISKLLEKLSEKNVESKPSARKKGDIIYTKKGKIDKRSSGELSEERKVKLRSNITKARQVAQEIWAKDGYPKNTKSKPIEEETEYEYEIKPRITPSESKQSRVTTIEHYEEEKETEEKTKQKPKPKAKKKYVKRLVAIDITDTEPETIEIEPIQKVIQNPMIPTKAYHQASSQLKNRLIGKIIHS